MIVLSHSMPDGDTSKFISAINLGAKNNIQYIILQIMHNHGQIGNNIFLVCSFWFLLSSKRTKTEKIFSLLIDAFLVSVISLVVFVSLGVELPVKYVIKQFAPTLFGNNWFLSCYILIYTTHPQLNYIIQLMENKLLIFVSMIMVTMYCVVYFVLRNSGYYYNDFIGFVVIYFLVATVKRINLYEKLDKRTMLLSILFIGLLMIGINYISVEIKYSLYDRWNNIINPLFIIIAILAFGIAKKTKIVTNKAINYLSSLSLLVYITHTNRIMRDYVRFEIFDWVKLNYTYQHLLAWCLLFFVFNLLYGMTFAILYKGILQNMSKQIAERVNRKLMSIWNL